MKYLLFSILFSLTCCFGANAEHPKEDIVIGVEEENWLYNFSANSSGIYSWITRTALTRANIKFRFSYVPKKRLTVALREGKIGVLGSVTLSKGQQRFDYSSSILCGNVIVFGRKQQIQSLATLEDIKGYRIGMGSGYKFPSYLGLEAGESGDKVTRDLETPQAFKMLEMGRLDYVIADELYGKLIIQKLGLSNAVQPELVIGNECIHLAFKKSMAQKQVIDRFNREIEIMKSNGLIDNYLGIFFKKNGVYN